MKNRKKPAGLCWMEENRPPAGRPSPWDGRWHGEKAEMVLRRHQVARLACAQCPRLEDCEATLSDFEKEGAGVDGIMAGRLCDVVVHGGNPVAIQSHCRACREKMQPQAKAPKGKVLHHERFHVGEGMCNKCHPQFSRAARRGAA